MHPQSLAWAGACVASLVAVTISDTMHRRIPNAMSLAIWMLGVSYWVVHHGLEGFATALLGSLVGGGMMLILYIMGFVGAGDVKVLMGFGAWLGPVGAFWAALYGLWVGGALSVLIIIDVGITGAQVRQGLRRLSSGQALVMARQQGTTVPLAAALAVGVILATTGYP